MNRQIKHEDFVEVLNQSIDTKLMVFTEGGICGLGSIALTEEGYIMSRTVLTASTAARTLLARIVAETLI